MKPSQPLAKVLFHSYTTVLLLILAGCGTLINSKNEAPKNTPFGYVEFSIDDTTRWLANGWTLFISETVNGIERTRTEKQNYGFLGRDVLLAPLGYTKVRRIPLTVGHHNVDLMIGGSVGPAHKMVGVDVIASTVAHFTVQIKREGGNTFSVSCNEVGRTDLSGSPTQVVPVQEAVLHPQTSTLTAGQSLVLVGGQTVEIPAGTVLRLPGGGSIKANGHHNTYNVPVGTIVRVRGDATGPSDSLVVAK